MEEYLIVRSEANAPYAKGWDGVNSNADTDETDRTEIIIGRGDLVLTIMRRNANFLVTGRGTAGKNSPNVTKDCNINVIN